MKQLPQRTSTPPPEQDRPASRPCKPAGKSRRRRRAIPKQTRLSPRLSLLRAPSRGKKSTTGPSELARDRDLPSLGFHISPSGSPYRRPSRAAVWQLGSIRPWPRTTSHFLANGVVCGPPRHCPSPVNRTLGWIVPACVSRKARQKDCTMPEKLWFTMGPAVECVSVFAGCMVSQTGRTGRSVGGSRPGLPGAPFSDHSRQSRRD